MDNGFTVESDELLTALGIPCHVSQAFDPTDGVTDYPRTQFDAMLDTGATKSIITQRVVEACGLKPMRRIKPVLLQGVDGYEKSEAYAVNIYLPGQITARKFTVFLKNPGKVWWDVLIGMDIISTGNLSVRNINSKTEWSFSIPSRQKK